MTSNPRFNPQVWTALLAFLIIGKAEMSAQHLVRNYDIPVEVNGHDLPNPWAGGLNSCQFSEIDLDQDGVKDLFVFDRVGDRISTYLNKSTTPGQIDYRYTREFQDAFPEGLRNWVFMRDFNCDGKEDLVTNSLSGMKIWWNTSSGGELSFSPAIGGGLITAFYDVGSNPFTAPIYTISPDLPSFMDYDGDGDTDIFSFTESSVGMYYYRNMQVELEDCDNFHFVCANRCYGMFNESPESFDLYYGDEFTCDFNVNNPRGDEEEVRHTGGTILQIDLDQNGIPDLILGDVTEPNMVALIMEDAQDGQDSTTLEIVNFPAPFGGTAAVDMKLFPGGFYLDVDRDGIRDLLTSPNAPFSASDLTSVWLYKNNGVNNLPSFEFVQNNFLQDGMIDLGECAYPVVEDVNVDGLPDLVIANRDYYSDDESFTSQLHLFLNNGTATDPSFVLEQSNWLDMPSHEWKSVYPAFGDLDGDLDNDLLVGEQNGFVHFFRNEAESGEPALYTLVEPLKDHTGTVIDIGQFAAPQIVDLNGDGLNDLVIGEKGGNINYYRNEGTESQFAFHYVVDSLGDATATNLLGLFGNSIPHFFKNPQDDWELLVGTETGQINHYNHISDGADAVFNYLTPDFENINEGSYSAVFVADLNADDKLDLIVGQSGGGVGIYLGNSWPDGVEEYASKPLLFYPNPADDHLRFKLDEAVPVGTNVLVTDLTGRLVSSSRMAGNEGRIDTRKWVNGIYIVTLRSGTSVWSGRIAIQHP